MRQTAGEPVLSGAQHTDSWGYRLLGLPFFNTLLAILILYAVCTAITGETFSTVQNQITILRAAAVFLILAVGQTLVMNTGGIDISTGSMVGVVGVLIGSGLQAGVIDPPLAIPLAIALGAALGAFNGFNVAALGVPPLLATLGTFVAYRGFAQHYMGANMVSAMPEVIVAFGRATLLGVPLAVYAAFAVALLGWWLLSHTLFGRYLTAIGSNVRAAEAARIDVRGITAAAYIFQGALAGLAALVLMGRLASASAALGEGLELHVIAAVVLGGTRLFGGRSTIVGTVLGVYLIGMLENGLIQTGAGFFVQRIILGLLIIAAVALQLRRREGA